MVISVDSIKTTQKATISLFCVQYVQCNLSFEHFLITIDLIVNDIFIIFLILISLALTGSQSLALENLNNSIFLLVFIFYSRVYKIYRI